MKNADVINGIRMLSFLKHHRGLRWLLGALLAVAAAYLWWQWMYPVAQFRYKLTVEVMTPDGLKSGSSVIEVRYSSSHPLPNPGRYYNDRLVAGEAVYVDLGHGKNLFVLLGTVLSGRSDVHDLGEQVQGPSDTGKFVYQGAQTALDLPRMVFGFDRKAGDEASVNQKVALLRGAHVSLENLGSLPTLVSFADPMKPETAVVLQPERLHMSLGDGYMLQKVDLQITDEPVSNKIIGVLPWLVELQAGRLATSGTSAVRALLYPSFKQPR